MGSNELLNSLPDEIGVYLMKNADGEVIYVGKAKSIKKRLKSHLKKSIIQSPKERALIDQTQDIEYVITDSELEALILENNFIKEYQPKFNISYKDDKTYPYIKITLNEPFPRIAITRDVVEDGAKYYGPYTAVGVFRESLNQIRRLFPVCNCNKVVKVTKKSRPCLDYHIKLCSAPCAGKIKENDYNDHVKNICLFLEGKQEELIKILSNKMEEASEKLEFEKSAKLRDQIKAIKKYIQKQKADSLIRKDQDVIAFAQINSDVCIQIFFLREGKIIGRKHFLMKEIEEDEKEILTAFIKQYYSDSEYIPQEIILQNEITELNLIKKWLSEKKGEKVTITVPTEDGKELKLVELVAKNATIMLNQIKLKYEQELQAKESLKDLKNLLGLPDLPFRIVAFDISAIHGAEAVGSLIVFENAQPKKEDYRRFKIKTVEGADDFAMMKEVIERYYNRLIKEGGNLPDLILVDGGKGQLNVCLEILKKLKIDTNVIGLAKEFERIYVPGKSEPIILSDDSQALYLIQRIRDEAHRFAIAYHRKIRSKKIRKSVLDEIQGIGEKRKQYLLQHFGSIDKIRKATIEELQRVPTISKTVAENIYKHFRS